MESRLRINKPLTTEFRPEQYVMNDALLQAVQVALDLNQPLLLTGEPGTGKTRLADRVAFELARHLDAPYNFREKPLIFNTKTTSTARDLFYTYDAVGHFQAANIKRENGQHAPKTVDFIELQALGKAIALTNPQVKYLSLFDEEDRRKIKEASSTVVLIDEIDKAPRDFPNDILNEIENYQFRIKELDNFQVERGKDQRIVVIMTSNSEKNLPDAFLRRCIFYHIPFPEKEDLLRIARTQLGIDEQHNETGLDQLLDLLLDYFYKVRELAPRKRPATAELIAWLRMLGVGPGATLEDLQKHRSRLRDNLSILVKTREDLEAVQEWMEGEFERWMNRRTKEQKN
jgi:MoxR-like ATPase